MENPTSLDVKGINFQEIRDGDVFLLCTDGILDGISEPDLLELFASNSSDQEVVHQINKKCQADSNDKLFHVFGAY